MSTLNVCKEGGISIFRAAVARPRELTCPPPLFCHVSRVVAVNENTVPEAVAASNNDDQTPLDVASSQECRAILTRASQVTRQRLIVLHACHECSQSGGRSDCLASPMRRFDWWMPLILCPSESRAIVEC